jgi:hypothetical protein
MNVARSSFVASMALALTLGVSGLAHAEPTVKEREKAAKLQAAGDKAAKAGKVDEAIDKHREAWSIAPNPVLGLALGKELTKVGKYVEAQDILFAVGSLDVPVKDSAKHKAAATEAAERANALDEKIATVEIMIDGGTMDVALKIDGNDYDLSGKKSKIKLDPGKHVIEVSRGDSSEKKTVDLEEKGRTKLKFKLKPIKSKGGEDAAEPVDEPTPVPKGSSAAPGWAWAAFGTGVAGVVVGGAGMIVGLTGGNDKAYMTPIGGAFTVFGALGIGVGIYGFSGGGSSSGGDKVEKPKKSGGDEDEGKSKEKEEGLSVRPWIGVGSIGVVGRF